MPEREQQMHEGQQGIREQLAQLGVKESWQMTLSNSIETHLTPAQIRAIAERSGVRLIVWNRPERVTAP